MIRVVVAWLAIALAACAQSPAASALKIYTFHMNRAACGSFGAIVGIVASCRQHIQVIATIEDAAVTGFALEVEYRTSSRDTQSQTAYVRASINDPQSSFRSAAAFFVNVDDVAILRVSVEPQRSAGPKVITTP